MPAVLAHCFLGHSGAWSRLIPALRTPIDALAFDLPGHGGSAPWDGQSDPLGFVAATFEELVDRPTLLIGHSFGGAAALRFAVAHPELVAGLVLIEPVYFSVAVDEPEFAANQLAEEPMHAAFRNGDLERAAAEFFALNGDSAGWAAMTERMRRQIIGQMPILAASLPRLQRDSGGVLEPGRLDELRAPVLLLDGANSPPIFDAVNRALARRLPHARRHTVPNAGHMLPITHAAEVAAVIDDWLDATPDGAEAGRQKTETRAG
nr:alpha/beta hydrolase [Pararhodobacter sp. SW119]